MITDRPGIEVEEAPPKTAPPAPDTPEAPPPEAPRPRRRRWPWLLLAVVALGVVYLLVHRSGSAKPAAKGKGGATGAAGDAASRPIPVSVAAAVAKDLGVYLTGLGTV